MDLLQPWGWAALLAAPGIVALYFLRQRRVPRVVGSLWLWEQARRDAQRGRPWDRFRPSALMWLQLMVVVGLALALARPACVSEQVIGQRVVVVLDGSGSMGATDVAPSRWGLAIEKARATVQAAPEGAEVALIVAGRLTRVAAPMGRDRGALLRRLDALAEQGPDDCAGKVGEALLLASELGGPAGERQVVLISDGAFDHAQLPAHVAGQTTFVGVGQKDENLAIITMEVRRAAAQRFGGALLCVVANTGAVPLSGGLEVSVDGQVRERLKVALDPGQTRALSVPLDVEQGRVEARLVDLVGQTDGHADRLAADDVGYAVLAPEDPLKVRLIGAGPLLERALASSPGIDLETLAVGEPPPQGAPAPEVTVYEGHFPDPIPPGRFLVLDPGPNNPLMTWAEGEPAVGPVVASWDEGHPVLHHVALGRVKFGEVRKALPIPALVPLAELAGQGGPLVLVGQTPTWRGVVWTTDLLETDLPLRVAFPVFLYNALGWLKPGGEHNLGRSAQAGQPLALKAAVGEQVEVRPPGGEPTRKTLAEGDTDGVFLWTDTSRAGFYEAKVGDRQAVFGVSMADELESKLKPAASLRLPSGASLPAQETVQHVDERATWAILGVLAIALLEWLLWLWRARIKR